jgi:hypothetical protein
MDENIERKELERKLEQCRQMLEETSDITTTHRLTILIENLEKQLRINE